MSILPPQPAGPEQRFQDAYDACATRVLAYALRHSDRESAHDVVADVFLVAWRRVDDLPDEPLPWLLVVARHTLANRRRSTLRLSQLEQRLADVAGTPCAPAAEDVAVDRSALLHALAQLSELEREALLLVAWDGLSATDAASVAGCSRSAFDARLHRARARLERGSAGPPPAPTARPSTTPSDPLLREARA